MSNPMLPILQKYGITEEEWSFSINQYEIWGKGVIPSNSFLFSLEKLILQKKINEALVELSRWHYIIEPNLIIHEVQPTGFESGKGGEYKEGVVHLYPVAFRDDGTLIQVVIHEFAHHLQKEKYPITDKIALLEQNEGKSYTFAQRELFAGNYTKATMDIMGYVFLAKNTLG